MSRIERRASERKARLVTDAVGFVYDNGAVFIDDRSKRPARRRLAAQQVGEAFTGQGIEEVVGRPRAGVFGDVSDSEGRGDVDW